MAPNVNIVVRIASAAPQQDRPAAEKLQDGTVDRLSHTLSGQSRAGLYQTGPRPRGTQEDGPLAMVAAARQAVAVLDQRWHRQNQQMTMSSGRRAKRKQWYGPGCSLSSPAPLVVFCQAATAHLNDQTTERKNERPNEWTHD